MVQSSSLGDLRCLNIWDASFLRLYIWLEVLYTIGVCGRWKNSQKSVLTSKLDAGASDRDGWTALFLRGLRRTRSIGHPPDVKTVKRACLQASLTHALPPVFSPSRLFPLFYTIFWKIPICWEHSVFGSEGWFLFFMHGFGRLWRGSLNR